MRQVRKSLALSYQVSGAGASSLSSAPPADQTVALWRRGAWTTLRNGSCRDAQIDRSGRSTDGPVVGQFADHIDSSLFVVSRGGVVEWDDEVRGELMTAPEFDKGTLTRALIGLCGQVTGLPDRPQAYGPSPPVKFLHSQALSCLWPSRVTLGAREERRGTGRGRRRLRRRCDSWVPPRRLRGRPSGLKGAGENPALSGRACTDCPARRGLPVLFVALEGPGRDRRVRQARKWFGRRAGPRVQTGHAGDSVVPRVPSRAPPAARGAPRVGPGAAARALAAAQAKIQAGAFQAAGKLLGMAEPAPLDEFERARVDLLRAQLAFAAGGRRRWP
jgi:hypothetical protein